jgi:hypothetical protein
VVVESKLNATTAATAATTAAATATAIATATAAAAAITATATDIAATPGRRARCEARALDARGRRLAAGRATC